MMVGVSAVIAGLLTKLHNTMKLLVLSLALLMAACNGPSQAPKLQTWGELRSVLRDGETQGRVELSRASAPGLYGLGAVAGLKGEVLVVDGEVWVSRATASDSAGMAGPPLEGEQATLLALGSVEQWSASVLPVTSDMKALELAVRTAAEAAGCDPTQPVPFVIEGIAASLDLHVLNGACPSASPPPEHEPYRASLDSAEVLLVGFYAEGMAGKLTHKGASSHVHVLTGGAQRVVGHVDGLRLSAGARLRVPER